MKWSTHISNDGSLEQLEGIEVYKKHVIRSILERSNLREDRHQKNVPMEGSS